MADALKATALPLWRASPRAYGGCGRPGRATPIPGSYSPSASSWGCINNGSAPDEHCNVVAHGFFSCEFASSSRDRRCSGADWSGLRAPHRSAAGGEPVLSSRTRSLIVSLPPAPPASEPWVMFAGDGGYTSDAWRARTRLNERLGASVAERTRRRLGGRREGPWWAAIATTSGGLPLNTGYSSHLR